MIGNTNEAVKSPLCECGSGLSLAHCCALQQVSLVSPSRMKQFAPVMQRAQQLAGQEEAAAAAQLCVSILEQAPAHTPALRLLIDLKKAEQQTVAQEALLKRLVKLQPNDGDLACELALLMYQKPDLTTAEYHARNGIRLQPSNPQAHNLMGMIFTDQGRSLSGEYHYRKALELHQPVGKLCANLGLNLRNQGKLDEAEKYYRQAMELEPDNITSLLGWVKVEEARREFDRAWELLHRAEAMQPDSGDIILNRATLFSRAREYDKALAELDRLEALNDGGEPGQGYCLERGRTLDKLKRYDEAFAMYDKANELIRTSGRGTYDEEYPRKQANRLKHFFKRSRMQILPRATVRSDCPQPLFIIGFPRSGTTMTEQILTAHPAICAGDELTFIGDLTRFGSKLLNSPLDYPESFSDLWMGDNQGALDDFRDWYLKRAQQLGIIEDGARWFTDKMPLNETHLGMIHMVFPGAPVVHLHRHPLDVILSTFFIDLTHGHRCSYHLKTAAQHYLLTMDLVEHYRRELDLRYLAVRYEDLVTDQEAHVRRLLEFIGEPWDERCMNFHENKRYARTASYAQVTEKLYTTSRFRYKNYRKHLDEIIPMLEPVIERLGYTIDD
jgi:tetratricopeptide (TPR) repeat protein